MSRFLVAMALAVLLAGCSAAAQKSVSESVIVHRAPPGAAENLFEHLAEDMSYDCIKSATDRHVARTLVSFRCVGAHNALLNAKSEQPYTDDNAVTASILEIYAAYALRQVSHKSVQEYHALLREADQRLEVVAKTASSEQTRNRARKARLCLLERDGGCLKDWADYQ